MAGTIRTFLQELLVNGLQAFFSKQGSCTINVEPCFSLNFLSDVDDKFEGQLDRTVPPAKYINLLNSFFEACGGPKAPYRKKSQLPNNPGSCKIETMHM